MHRLTLTAVLLLPSCSISFGPSAWVTENDAFEVDRAQLTAVSVATHNGSVAVAGVEGDKIVVRVTKKAGGADEIDAEDALEAIEILHKRVDSGLALGWRWREPRASSWHAVVSFDVTQPPGLPVSVETHNGSVRLASLQGAVSVRTHNGVLSLQDCAGKVDGVTYNGRIDAKLSSADLELRTHNGRVHVVLDGDGPVNGAIRSHNGSVHLDLAGERTARLVCNTHNGRVACDRSLTRVERGRNFLVADLSGGSPSPESPRQGRLEVETHNGSIRVE